MTHVVQNQRVDLGDIYPGREFLILITLLGCSKNDTTYDVYYNYHEYMKRVKDRSILEYYMMLKVLADLT